MFSVREAASRLNVAQMTVLRHINAGTIPATPVDGRYVIFESDLVHFEQNRPRRGWPPGKPRGPRRKS